MSKKTDNHKDVRAHKQARFSDSDQRRQPFSPMPVLVGACAVILVAAAVFVWLRGGTRTAQAIVGATEASVTSAVAQGDEVTLPLSTFDDGKARFYTYQAGDVSIQYFVLKSSDGVVRAAFNACDVCYGERKGYRQEGDEMVCNNCGRRFPSVLINEVQGGCNPAPLERAVEGTDLVIQVDDILAGIVYFQ